MAFGLLCTSSSAVFASGTWNGGEVWPEKTRRAQYELISEELFFTSN
jgi:hypothetical protein